MPLLSEGIVLTRSTAGLFPACGRDRLRSKRSAHLREQMAILNLLRARSTSVQLHPLVSSISHVDIVARVRRKLGFVPGIDTARVRVSASDEAGVIRGLRAIALSRF